MTVQEVAKGTVSQDISAILMACVLIFAQNGQSGALLEMVTDRWETAPMVAFATKTVLVRLDVPNLNIMEKLVMAMAD